jgi:hypothetical protein
VLSCDACSQLLNSYSKYEPKLGTRQYYRLFLQNKMLYVALKISGALYYTNMWFM